MITSPLIQSAVEILRQGEGLLASLDEDLYTRKVPEVFNSAIGGHYRHCLDHFQCLLEGLMQGEVDYDDRQRDPRIEHNRRFALDATSRLRDACEKIRPAALELPVQVVTTVNYDGLPALSSASSFGRELIYAVAHAIHHYALIAVMCRKLGVPVPTGFGIAPSTLQHRTAQAEAA